MKDGSAVLKVIKPGMLCLLQDFGRFGYLHQGHSRGGPIDERAFLWGNRLLGNPATAAQLEITLGGAEFEVLADCFISLCGAPQGLFLDDTEYPSWQVVYAHKGMRLKLPFYPYGLRGYLAIAGGFDALLVKGSCATVVREAIGGHHGDGRPLQANDELKANLCRQQPILNQRVKPKWQWEAPEELCLSVVPTAQYEQFAEPMQKRFTNTKYKVSKQQDRMGARLQSIDETRIEWSHDGLISEPLPIGAIQIPPDGQPIVMLNDRQSLGGYPKIGT